MTIPPRKFMRRNVVTAYVVLQLSNAVMRVLYWNNVDFEFRANRSPGSKDEDEHADSIVQNVQLKSGAYFKMSNLFTNIYNMLYYTTNLYLQ